MRTFTSLVKSIGLIRARTLIRAEHPTTGYQTVRLHLIGADLAAELAEYGIAL